MEIAFNFRCGELPLYSVMRCCMLTGILLLLLVALAGGGCSSVRHVPDGSFLLDKVNIVIDDTVEVDRSELRNYLRQQPNHKVLGFAKLQLAMYNLSGRDTTKWYNRWVRRLGQPPVIYDAALTDASARQLRQAMINKGYMHATVDVDTFGRDDKKKMEVTYRVNAGAPHRIASVNYDIADTAMARLVLRDSTAFTLAVGDKFDRAALESERVLITERLRNHGYYAFAKDYITFIADTADNSLDVDLTMVINVPSTARKPLADNMIIMPDKRYVISRVVFMLGVKPKMTPLDSLPADEVVHYRGITVAYCDGDRYLKPSILEEKCHLQAGSEYSAQAVQRTYEALAQLSIIKSINIEMKQLPAVDGVNYLEAVIYITRNKKQGITFELEGTNSEGDFGFGLGMDYRYRNLGRRSNMFNTKLRVNYESLSGDFTNLINNRYTEYAAETSITFPKFMFPFISRQTRLRSKASTEVSASFNYQQRPEYTRIIAGAAWKYRWSSHNGRRRSTFDLLDINYVYLPESTIDFLNQIAPSNPLLRYSYEDHFIMRIGYSYYRSNRRIPSSQNFKSALQTDIYTFRFSAETAGNLLYAISSLSGKKRNEGVYTIFGIQFSQYAKAEIDYSLTHNLSTRHSLAFHAGFGIGVPYGNSTVLPFEKRFYAGGANGVRGWGVRTLGPGAFDSRNSVTDFINQCGDIMLNLSVEYRAKLFWVFEGALFVDAGNVWTIRSYENQPHGVFRFGSFWRQIALSYGAGIRLDFTYFLLRFDLGMKAHNPAYNHEPWPLIHPNWKRDATFHFAVGYPF